MDEPDFNLLRSSHILIWGLGLMGGSLALALRGKCSSLAGVDTDVDTLAFARDRGVVDQAFSVDEVRDDPVKTLGPVDFIILATPVRTILDTLGELPELCAHPAAILDMGSTKTEVVRAMAGLPERFDPLGGHPMCGKEKSSLMNAEAALFKGAPFVLVNLPRTSSRGRELAEALVKAIEADPIWLDAEEHDRWVASTSHLPFLAACALAQCTPEAAAVVAGPGFRSATRLAGSSTRMMVDILATNAENIRIAMKDYMDQLGRLEGLLEQGDFEGLAAQFEAGAAMRERLIQGNHSAPDR